MMRLAWMRVLGLAALPWMVLVALAALAPGPLYGLIAFAVGVVLGRAVPLREAAQDRDVRALGGLLIAAGGLVLASAAGLGGEAGGALVRSALVLLAAVAVGALLGGLWRLWRPTAGPVARSADIAAASAAEAVRARLQASAEPDAAERERRP